MSIKKRLGKAENQSKYKNVHATVTGTRSNGSDGVYWKANVVRDGVQALGKYYKSEREAAKAVDWFLIKRGESPVNGFFTKVKQ